MREALSPHVFSQTRRRVLRIPPSEERKVREVQAGYPDSDEAEHHFAGCGPSPRVGRGWELGGGAQ